MNTDFWMTMIMCLSCFQGCGPSCLEQGYSKLREKTTHHPNLEVEGEGNESHTIINFSGLSTDSSFSNQSQGTQTNEPATSYLISILGKIFPSRPINNHNTTRYLATLEAKEILAMGFAALIGLLSVSYRINGHGNLVPTSLFHQPTCTFFLIIIMISVYFPAIGIILEKASPMTTKVLNAISFVCIVLGVTVLLRAFVPRCVSWIPWIFFACTVVAAFGVIVYGPLKHRRSTLRSTTSLGSPAFPPIEVWILLRDIEDAS